MKKFASLLLAVCLLASLVSFSFAEESKMHYGYATLSFADFWAGELGVAAAELDKSNDRVDKEGYADTAMFDAVTRPTDHHGVYRTQMMFDIELQGAKVLSSKEVEENGKKHKEYELDESQTNVSKARALYDGLNEDDKIKTKDVEGFLNFADRQETYEVDGVEYKLTQFQIKGIRYVPVAVPENLLEVAKEKYDFQEACENCVNADTNGLKTMLDENSFSARQVKDVENPDALVSDGGKNLYKTKYGSDAEFYINIVRADGKELTMEDLAKYLTSYQTTRIDYYGDDANYSNLVASYGTKHASDSWWSPSIKRNRIDVGINYSYDRFKGAGPGYYRFTLIAKGYPDIVAETHFLPFVSSALGKDAEISVEVDGSKLSLKGIEDYTKGATVDIKKGKGKKAEPVASGLAVEDNAVTLENALEAGEYTLSVNLADFAPEEVYFEVK